MPELDQVDGGGAELAGVLLDLRARGGGSAKLALELFVAADVSELGQVEAAFRGSMCWTMAPDGLRGPSWSVGPLGH